MGMGRDYFALALPPSEKMAILAIRGSLTSFLELPPPPVPLRSSWEGMAKILDVAAALVASDSSRPGSWEWQDA
jgi:hypothetical protein